MREILTSGSVGGLVEQSPSLPGQSTCRVKQLFILALQPLHRDFVAMIEGLRWCD